MLHAGTLPLPPASLPVSYCVVCDALPGECDHNGHRYLDPIQYEKVEAPEGGRVSWRVPDSERARVDNPPSTWPKAPPRQHRPARPLDELLADASRHVYVDDRLEGQLESLYAFDPVAVTEIVAAVIDGAGTGSMHSPSAFLASRLKRLVQRSEGRTSTQ